MRIHRWTGSAKLSNISVECLGDVSDAGYLACLVRPCPSDFPFSTQDRPRSIVTYIACIMSFMWRVSANLPSDHFFLASPSTELSFRIFICIVLGVGVIYGALIINTFRRYGGKMDEAWKRRVESYLANSDSGITDPTPPPQHIPIIPPPQHTPIISPPKLESTRSSESDATPYIGAILPKSISGLPPAFAPLPATQYPVTVQLPSSNQLQTRSPSPDPVRTRPLPSRPLPARPLPARPRSSSRHQRGRRRRTPSHPRTQSRSQSRPSSYTSYRVRRRSKQRYRPPTPDPAEGERQYSPPSPIAISPPSANISPPSTPSHLDLPLPEKTGEIIGPAELIERQRTSYLQSRAWYPKKVLPQAPYSGVPTPRDLTKGSENKTFISKSKET